MTMLKFTQFVNDFVRMLRELAPYDTGNLAENAIQFHYEEDKQRAIIEVNTQIAPYMPFTNEPWISPKWNEKKNPNEAWWENAIIVICTELSQKYGGIFTV